MTQFEKYEIDRIDALSADTKVFRLRPLGGSVWSFIPGQFVFIHILDENENSVVKKPFSIASAPGGNFLEFCIKLIHGNFTGKLELLREGAVLGVEKPAGHFTFGGAEKAGFIAGGTGIAPIISILRHIADRQIKGEFVFFYSSKTAANMLYADELDELQRKNSAIRVVNTVTADPAGWKGETGRIDSKMIGKYLPDAKSFSWWICGPTEMVKSMRQNLEALGADPKKMKMEGWG